MSARHPTIVERAPAKANLVLRVGPPRADGLHPLCSIFASLELADEVAVEVTGRGRQGDAVLCPGVEGKNLAAHAIAAYRGAAPDAIEGAVTVTIVKRIPVAAGLGGGSADAAATLRALDRLAERPLGADRLRELGAQLGADVPSQIEPRHALVQGVGEQVEPLELPPLALVLVPAEPGLSTAAVYAELDRLRALGETSPARVASDLGPGEAPPHPDRDLDPAPLRALVEAGLDALAAGLENDLEAAALSLRPELAATLEALRHAGALGARITGSGPTALGVFADRLAAERAAASLGAGGGPASATGSLEATRGSAPSAIVTELEPS